MTCRAMTFHDVACSLLAREEFASVCTCMHVSTTVRDEPDMKLIPAYISTQSPVQSWNLSRGDQHRFRETLSVIFSGSRQGQIPFCSQIWRQWSLSVLKNERLSVMESLEFVIQTIFCLCVNDFLQCLRTLHGHTGGVWCSQFVGNTVISGSTDRTLKVDDLFVLSMCRWCLTT